MKNKMLPQAQKLRRKLTLEDVKKIYSQAKAIYTFFPDYTLRVCYLGANHLGKSDEYHVVFNSNSREVLEYVQRHAGGEFQQELELLIKIKE